MRRKCELWELRHLPKQAVVYGSVPGLNKASDGDDRIVDVHSASGTIPLDIKIGFVAGH
jgi:hypothetical protein